MRHAIAGVVFSTILCAGCQSVPASTEPRFAIAVVGVEEAVKAAGFDFDPAAFELHFLATGVYEPGINGVCMLTGAVWHEALADFRMADSVDVVLSSGARTRALILVSHSRYLGPQQPEDGPVPMEVYSPPPVRPIPDSWRGDLSLFSIVIDAREDGSPKTAIAPRSPFSFTIDGQSKYLGLFRLQADAKANGLFRLDPDPAVENRAAHVLGLPVKSPTPPVLGSRDWVECRK